MSTHNDRAVLTFLIPLALLALSGCGSGNARFRICPTANCCGPTSNACLAPQYLYATGLSGQIVGFPVESNGALGLPVTTSDPSLTLGMTAINNQFLYVSDFQNEAIDAWTINASTGALTPVATSPFSLGSLSFPAGLAADGAGEFLYVADAGRIDGLKADATGALTAVPDSPVISGTNLYLTVDPQNRFLFASDEVPPGSVLAFTIDSGTGALTAVPNSPFATIPGYLGDTRPGAIAVDSSGSFVFTVLTATNQVAAFSITASSGALTPAPGSPFSTGPTPFSLTTANSFVYVSNAMDGTISGYSINPASGVLLMPLAGSPFAIRAGVLTTDPAGQFLYASGEGGIQAFTINPTTGALNQIAGSPFPAFGVGLLTFVQ